MMLYNELESVDPEGIDKPVTFIKKQQVIPPDCRANHETLVGESLLNSKIVQRKLPLKKKMALKVKQDNFLSRRERAISD